MTDWDGTGLPPAASARLARARASGVATSLLAVAAQSGLDACGFAAVGEVMGCLVEHIGWQGYAGCGWYGSQMGIGQMGYGYASQFETLVAGPGSAYGFAPYVDAVNAGWQGAIQRMLIECAALGADGVVGVRLEERHLGEDNREFVALGTAVRSLGTTHARRPFATTLEGQDLAKLLHARWAPVSIVVAIAVGIRHDDYQTRQASYLGAYNQEVPGYTDLVLRVREEARSVLERGCRDAGADGAILTSPMWLSVRGLEVGEGHTDHAAEAGLSATTLAYFGTGTSAPSARKTLTILPLS